MDNAGYTTLTRQSGLLSEMQAIANNIANASTTGYRREGLIFSEFVAELGGDAPALSMATGNIRDTRMEQGPLTQTGGTFDFAIEGDGFFMIEGPDGPMLTRAGSFTPNAAGELVTPEGLRVLDAGGTPIFAPPDAANFAVASDGTISADGDPIGELGVYLPADPTDMRHRDGVRFEAPGGTVPVFEDVVIMQGFLEGSNVDAVGEIARMIEVQRAYEQGQAFVEGEDERIRAVLRTLGA